MSHNLNSFVNTAHKDLLIYLLKYLQEEDMRALAWASRPIRERLQAIKNDYRLLPFRARVFEPLVDPSWQLLTHKQDVDAVAFSRDGKLLCVATSHASLNPLSASSLNVYVYQYQNGKFQLLKSHKQKNLECASLHFSEDSTEVVVDCRDPYVKGVDWSQFKFNYKTGECSELTYLDALSERATFAALPFVDQIPEIHDILTRHQTTLRTRRGRSANGRYWALATELVNNQSLILICEATIDGIKFVSEHTLADEIIDDFRITNDGGLLTVRTKSKHNLTLNLTTRSPTFTRLYHKVGILNSSSRILEISPQADIAVNVNGSDVKVCHLQDDGLAREVRDAVQECLASNPLTLDAFLKHPSFQTLVTFRLAYDHRIDEPQYLVRLRHALSSHPLYPLHRLLELANALRIACVRYFQEKPKADLAMHPGCLGFQLIAQHCGAQPFTGVFNGNIHSPEIGKICAQTFLYKNDQKGRDPIWKSIQTYCNKLPNSQKKEVLSAFLNNGRLLKEKDLLPMALACEQYNRCTLVTNLGMHRKPNSKQLLPKGFVKLVQSHSECQNLLTLEVFIKAVMARAYAKDDKKLLEDLQAVWARIEDAANNNPCLWGDIHALTSFPFFQKASLIEVLINTPWKNKLLEVFQDLAPVEKKAFHKRLIH